MRPLDYASVDLLAALLSVLAAGVAWRRWPAPGSRAFVVFASAAAWWCAWSAVNQLAPDLPTNYTAVRLSWIGAAMAPTAYLVVALQYVGHESRLRRRTVAFLAVEPLATILVVWTNDLHGLMWSAIRINERGPVPFFDSTHGPWFWAHEFYAILLAVLTAARLGQVLFASPHQLYRSQAGLLVAGLFVVILSNFLYLADLSPIGRGHHTRVIRARGGRARRRTAPAPVVQCDPAGACGRARGHTGRNHRAGPWWTNCRAQSGSTQIARRSTGCRTATRINGASPCRMAGACHTRQRSWRSCPDDQRWTIAFARGAALVVVRPGRARGWSGRGTGGHD